MTKTELIAAIMKRKKDHKAQSDIETSAAVNHIINQITASLADGERIEVRGFGSFKLNEWGARHARNPKTGESWRTEPTKAVYFKPGKELKTKVNQANDVAEESEAG